MNLKKDIVNELGNTIHLEVKEEMIMDLPVVSLRMEGPTSVMENRVTRDEALALCELLNALLHIDSANAEKASDTIE